MRRNWCFTRNVPTVCTTWVFLLSFVSIWFWSFVNQEILYAEENKMCLDTHCLFSLVLQKWAVRLLQHYLQVPQSVRHRRGCLHWLALQLPIMTWLVSLSVLSVLTMCCHQFFSVRVAILFVATVAPNLRAVQLAEARWAPSVTWLWRKLPIPYYFHVNMPLPDAR